MSNNTQFDFSNWNFPEDRIWLRIPEAEMIAKIVTFIPVLIFGIVANFVIIRLIIQNRSLRTPSNLIIANMALANCLTLLICPVLFMINDFYQNFLLGSLGCKLEGFLEGALLITAVLNLAVVSYDRLTAIVLPSETRLSIRGTKIVICLTWLAGILIALPLALYRSYKERQWRNFRETYCKENQHILHKYWYVLITIMVWIPLGIMLICYSAIFYKLDRYEKRNMSREHPLTVSYKRTIAKTLFVILIVFVALRLPFTILVLMRNKMANMNASKTINSSYSTLWYISQYLMFVNAAVNPVIYGYKNENFRRAYDQTPLCTCYKRRSRHINTKEQNNAACSQSLSKWIPAHFCCWSKQEAYNLSKINHKSTMDITKYSAGCIVDEGFI